MAINDIADVGGVDALDILHRIDFVLQIGGIKPTRHGQMQHDAGDGWIVIERLNQRGDIVLFGVRRQSAKLVLNSDGQARLPLPLGVQFPRRRRSDQDGGEMHAAALERKDTNAGRHILSNLCGDRRSVDPLVCHIAFSVWERSEKVKAEQEIRTPNTWYTAAAEEDHSFVHAG